MDYPYLKKMHIPEWHQHIPGTINENSQMNQIIYVDFYYAV